MGERSNGPSPELTTADQPAPELYIRVDDVKPSGPGDFDAIDARLGRAFPMGKSLTYRYGGSSGPEAPETRFWHVTAPGLHGDIFAELLTRDRISALRLVSLALLGHHSLCAPEPLRHELASLIRELVREGAKSSDWDLGNAQAPRPNESMPPGLRKGVRDFANLIEKHGSAQITEWPQGPVAAVTTFPQGYLATLNAQTYHAIRDALARNLFVKTDSTPWPTADISAGANKGFALLAPIDPKDAAALFPEQRDALVERMWAQRQQLSDLDADTLDALHAHWILTRNTDGYAAITIDQILKMRGLKPKRDGHGRRGGFEREQREEMRRSVTHVSNVWIRMHQQEVFDKTGKGRRGKRRMEAVESRVMVITDRGGQITLDGYLEVDRLVYRPGHLFERFLQRDGRQVALLSAQALHYDPYRHTWEKRLTRFLSFHWRCIASRETLIQRYRVRTLLKTIGVDLVPRRGHRIKDRLERALDERLLRDGIVGAWQYDGWDDSAASGRGWFKRWLLAVVVIEAPDAIKNYYAQGGLARTAAVFTSVPIHTTADLHERLKAERETRGLSQLQVAEQLGIGQGQYSKLERGARPRKALRARVEKWLEQRASGAGRAPS